MKAISDTKKEAEVELSRLLQPFCKTVSRREKKLELKKAAVELEA